MSEFIDKTRNTAVKDLQIHIKLCEAHCNSMENPRDKEAQVFIKHLKSALAIVDGSRHAMYSKTAKKMHKAGRKPKGSMLDKHRDRIIEALGEKISIAKIARELGVQRSTLSDYVIKKKLKND